MILKRLEIELERFGVDKGQYKGTVEFTDANGRITLNLNQQHIQAIFETCSSSLLDMTKTAASQMAIAVVAQQRANQDEEDAQS